MSLRQFVAVAFVVAAACYDPVLPAGAVRTLDDAGGGTFTAIAVGGEHSCALTADSSAYCWGSNEYGQLGSVTDSTTCRRIDRNIPCALRPQAVVGGLKFSRISTGLLHTCGIAANSRVYCWGSNANGQLGDPSLTQSDVPMPIASVSLFVDVAAGSDHSCAVRTDGAAGCWGGNDYGQLGSGGSGNGVTTPVLVQTATRFSNVTAGSRRTCGRATDDAIHCWGAFWVARVNGEEVIRPQGVPVRLVPNLVMHDVSVGGSTTCGLVATGLAYCWEANGSGSIGNGTHSGSTIPMPVRTTEKYTSIVVGSAHACGIAETGLAYCWGSDPDGQLGVSSSQLDARCADSAPCRLTPVRVGGWRTFSKLAAGLGSHVCGITLAGNVYCWGAGAMGQRGDGHTGSTSSPVRTLAP